jgi:hypothetical protein
MQLIKLKVINKRDIKNFKILEVPGNMTLYKFAEVIVKSFGFYFDHCFGFYDNFDNPSKSTKIFELFTDLEDVEHTPNAKGVKKYYFVGNLFEKNKRMLFLFDYCQVPQTGQEFSERSCAYLAGGILRAV